MMMMMIVVVVVVVGRFVSLDWKADVKLDPFFLFFVSVLFEKLLVVFFFTFSNSPL